MCEYRLMIILVLIIPIPHMCASFLMFLAPDEMNLACEEIVEIAKTTILSDFIYLVGMCFMTNGSWTSYQWTFHIMQFYILILIFLWLIIRTFNQHCVIVSGMERAAYIIRSSGLILNFIYLIILTIAAYIQCKMVPHETTVHLTHDQNIL
jgi:hypothetical protein